MTCFSYQTMHFLLLNKKKAFVKGRCWFHENVLLPFQCFMTPVRAKIRHFEFFDHRFLIIGIGTVTVTVYNYYWAFILY